MDETAVWQDMLFSTTVDNVGEKSIRLKTKGHEKSKVPVFLKQRQTVYCLWGSHQKQISLMGSLKISAM